jgi:protein-S-isoprenylcysteine O-methyltransferase Ste14
MSDKKTTEPNKSVALAYVIAQVIILILLIFVNSNYGFNVSRFIFVGTVLEWIGILGILISAYSIRRSLTAMPLPKEHGKLATNGLYKYVRHPMYTSVLLFSLGLALSSGEIYKYLLVVGLSILFYYKSVYEEIYLARKYVDYKNYTKRTPRFIPFSKHI